MNNHHRQHRPQRQTAPNPKLAAFLSETLGAVQAGDIGREMAAQAIKAWPAIHAADHAAKVAALRQLAANAGGTHA